MSNNLKIMGNTFSNVSSITAHDATSGTHTYYDTSTVNATAGDVKSGKKIINSSGTEITGTLANYNGNISLSSTETISSLANTTWLFKYNLDFSTTYQWSINFISNNNTYTGLACVVSWQELWYYSTGSSPLYLEGNWNSGDNYLYQKIKIIDGTDISSSTLINWLNANAILIKNEDSNVTVRYGNAALGELTEDNTLTLNTNGKISTNNITIEYNEIDTLADYINNGKTYTSFENSNITNIFTSMFYSYQSLTTVNAPACLNISNYAFARCAALSNISFPMCASIGEYAFSTCASLKSVNFPACTYISSNAFQMCLSLTTISFPVCSSIGYQAFYVTGIGTANFPECLYIDTNAFYYNTNLTTISFPSCRSIGLSAFYGCTALRSANFPNCTSIGSNAFMYCSSMTTASFPLSPSIKNSVFTNCYNLISLYLLGSNVVNLVNTNAFTSTPIAGYTGSTGGVYGSIYVPASLYSSYISATNWTTFSSRFVSV